MEILGESKFILKISEGKENLDLLQTPHEVIQRLLKVIKI